MTKRSDQPIVSRETMGIVEELEALVQKWSTRINLVSKHGLADLRKRHTEDSLQVALARDPEAGPWLDIGSGGGFPGLVIAAVHGHRLEVVLVESDSRKCAFLNAARRELGLEVRIVNDRIESIPSVNARVVTARALAPLDTLLSFSAPHAHPNCQFIFPKGKTWEQEVLDARTKWNYELEVQDSTTDEESVILHIRNVSRA